MARRVGRPKDPSLAPVRCEHTGPKKARGACRSCYKKWWRGTSPKGKEEDVRRYGLSAEQYYAMSEAQDGVCWICSGADKKKALSVDHDHKTGKIRGLLCTKCNVALSAFKDDIRLLFRAVTYLVERG